MKISVAKPVPTYDQARRQAYPPLGEQLDMLWHAMDEGVLPVAEPWYSVIKAVKKRYPDPDEQSR